MENQGQSLTGKLNHLIALAEDGKYGYESAAKDVKDSAVKSLLYRFSAERAAYIHQLQYQVSLLGEEPKKSGGPIGTLHRTWINLKAAATHGDKDAIVKECIAGEEYALKEYETVISLLRNNNSPLLQILASHRDGIQAALISIKALSNK